MVQCGRGTPEDEAEIDRLIAQHARRRALPMAKLTRGRRDDVTHRPIDHTTPARQQWQQLVAAQVALGMTRAAAVSAVNRRNKSLRERVVAGANRGRIR